VTVRVEHGDCREVIPTLGVTVDSVVTDPPYNLEAMAKRFGPGQKAATSPDHQRFAKGFMGMTWDSDVAFQPETWATIGSVLRPGGFLLAFGGTRTYHRLTCAIEDAGFVIQDCLMWLFATGFPKRRDMLKPAYEPIVLAYKPGGKRTLQVDECRISAADQVNPCGSFKSPSDMSEGWSRPWMGDRGELRSRKEAAIDRANTLGRWPANICHDGSDEVAALFPESGGQQGDVRGTEPSPVTDAVYGQRARVPFNKRAGEATAEKRYAEDGASDFAMLPGASRRAAGSAARFFMSAKAGAQDRWGSRHPTVKPVELMKWLVALVTPPGGTVLDPFAGSGTTAVAALATGRNAILIEQDASYCEDIRARLAHYEGVGRHSLVAKGRKASSERSGAEGTPLFPGASQ
jgi:site-specific DNA-methyltransferase (adenine-specific)